MSDISSNYQNVFDICCGAGGLSLGFSQAGFNILGGIDNQTSSIETIKYNHWSAKWFKKTIEKFSKELDEDYEKQNICFNANVIVAGLPCQGFSTAGKRNLHDYRNTLYKHLIKIVGLVRPEFVVFENVLGLTHKNNEVILKGITKGFTKLGYKYYYKILNAEDFNVPQYRKRVILIASLNFEPFCEIFPYVRKYTRTKNVRQAFSGLSQTKEIPEINHTFMKHGKKVINKIKSINNKIHLSYRKLFWNEPSCTVIVGHNALPVHPSQYRAISIREAARLQGFPDSYIFKGSRTSQSEQVANAVPPPLARAIAKAILKAYHIKNGCINERAEKKKHAKYTFSGNKTRAYNYART